MKTSVLKNLVLSTAMILALCSSAFAQEKMETRDTRIGKLDFENGYPSNESVEKLYDKIDFQRACQAYIWGWPFVQLVGRISTGHK